MVAQSVGTHFQILHSPLSGLGMHMEKGGALFALILLTFWVSGGGFCNVIVRSRFANTKPSFRCKGAKHKIPLDSTVCSNQLCGREQPAWTVPSPGLSPPGGM